MLLPVNPFYLKRGILYLKFAISQFAPTILILSDINSERARSGCLLSDYVRMASADMIALEVSLR
jgi:hypothetical protein